MNKFASFILISLLLSFFPKDKLKAQDVEIGFRLEILGLQRSYTSGNSFGYNPFPSSLQLNFAIYPIKNLAFEIRGGRIFFFDNFIGYEYGIYSKYFFWL